MLFLSFGSKEWFHPRRANGFQQNKKPAIKGARHRVSGVALDCRLGSAIEIPATRNEYIPRAY